MLSARDYYFKCWNYKLRNFRRCSLPETLFPPDAETSLQVPFWKSSDTAISKLTCWNDRPIPPRPYSLSTNQRVVIDMEDIKDFIYSPKDFVWLIAYSDYVFNSVLPATKFDLLLQSAWSKASEKGVFRYKLDTLQTAILPGKIGFVAQLNPKRASERRTPQAFSRMSEPFDPDQFNFTKIKEEEIFFSLSQYRENLINGEVTGEEQQKNFIIANISPLEYCNVLLIPKLQARRPQVVTEDMLRLALHTILLSGTWKFRVGFNSLGALASVNHLHCHAYYIGYNLPTESLPADPFVGPCYIVRKYPAGGFVFQFPPVVRKCETLDDELERFIKEIYDFVSGLHKEDIPHNIFITRGTPLHSSMSRKRLVIRLYVWTREFFHGAKAANSAFNAALCELSGHLPVFTKEGFDTLTEAQVSKILEDVSQEMFYKAKPVAERSFAGL